VGQVHSDLQRRRGYKGRCVYQGCISSARNARQDCTISNERYEAEAREKSAEVGLVFYTVYEGEQVRGVCGCVGECVLEDAREGLCEDFGGLMAENGPAFTLSFSILVLRKYLCSFITASW
jgi:hypothetical protein